MLLVTGVTARKRSESECFLWICEILLNYVLHIKNNRISWSPYIEKWNCFYETAILLQQNDQEENDLGHGGNCLKMIRRWVLSVNMRDLVKLYMTY